MGLLDSCGVVARYNQRQVAQVAEQSAISSEQSDPSDVQFLCRLERLNDIGGVARRGDADQAIPGFAERADLSRKHLIEAVVVADAGECRGVSGQSERREGSSFSSESAGELRRDMLAVSRRASVSA